MLLNVLVAAELAACPVFTLAVVLVMNKPLRRRIGQAIVTDDPDPRYSRLDNLDGLHD